MKIPFFYLRDKQAFTSRDGIMRLAGKPIAIARDLQDEGVKLIHFRDMDALSGQSNNFDIFSGLTYFINVQVECSPRDEQITKLLSLKCRVVLPPGTPVAQYREKKLLVAKIPPGYDGEAADFHDVILEEADEKSVKKFEALGKRVMIFEKDSEKVKSRVWGVISSS
ncbi:MAG TPA: hypothetical protein VLD37_04420 [Candidatus Bilamarchaeum sp.]|nr:hypothetical protein [Candidatus Bilamarchaeum sp.]